MAKPEKIEQTELTPDMIFDTTFEGGLKVTYAFLHQTLAGPGIPAERSINQQKLPGGDFRWTPMGLLIKYRNTRIGIPAANVCNWFV